jgi:hypothetical protein
MPEPCFLTTDPVGDLAAIAESTERGSMGKLPEILSSLAKPSSIRRITATQHDLLSPLQMARP